MRAGTGNTLPVRVHDNDDRYMVVNFVNDAFRTPLASNKSVPYSAFLRTGSSGSLIRCSSYPMITSESLGQPGWGVTRWLWWSRGKVDWEQ